MVKKISALVLLSSLSVFAQDKKDIDAIKKMCGCYEVTFKYAETFNNSTDPNYKPSKSSESVALEWVTLAEEKKDKLAMQHLLIVGKRERQRVIKHWRQDWVFQNTDFYQYDFDNQWKYSSKSKNDVKGQWTQKVFQVDDSPRYEQTATWAHLDGKSFWESEVSSPTPRRDEEIARNDYNVLYRRNRHEITSYGWLHEQDNDKVQRASGKEDFIIAQEKGYNTYKKVDESLCKSAKDYWEKHKNKWALVRAEWDKVFAKNKNISITHKIDDKTLYEKLSDEKINTDKQIREVISRYVSQN